MANTPPSPNLSQEPDEELFADLQRLDTDTRLQTAARVITELQGRGISLNKIAERSGIARATVQRWAQLADGDPS